MTNNQISYANYLEQKRHNLATEKVSSDTLSESARHNMAGEAISRSTLSETIANNLRNYDVNVTKNDIQSLANDQLNVREIAKLSETIRNNLTNYLETNRHNMKTEEIQSMANTIKGLKTAADPWTMLASILGLFDDSIINQLYGSTSGISKTKNKIDDLLNNLFNRSNSSSGNTSDSNESAKPSKHRGTKPTPGFSGGEVNHSSFSGGTGVSSSPTTTKGRGGKEYVKDDKDEIPLDYSNSKGPTSSSSKTTSYAIPSANSTTESTKGSTVSSYSIPDANNHGRTSGGTNYTASGGLHSSGVIYSGSTSVGPGV